MIRVKRGNIAAKRRKKYLKLAKGYVGSNSRLSTMASEQVVQSFNYSYKSRKLKKRIYRTFWIHRINSALHVNNNNYSKFMKLLKINNIFLNKEMLAHLAFNNLPIFNLIESKLKNNII
jgi:large subunit ribosomal protein L20